MDIKSLKFFITVAEYRNFTKAAEHLFITQSALSHSIAELEAELDTKLFWRTTRSVSLTPSGEVLYKSARDLISRFNQIQTDIRKANDGVAGELVIGYIITAFSDILSEATMRFHTKYPDIRLHYVRKNEGSLLEAFSRGELDLAVFGSFDVERLKNVEWKPLFPDCLGLVVRPDHALAGVDCIDNETLRKEQFVFLLEEESPNMQRLILQICAARGFAPNIVSRVDRIDALILEIKADLAISIMSYNGYRYYARDLCFVELGGDDTACFGAIAWNKGGNNPVIPLFLSMLDDYMSNTEYATGFQHEKDVYHALPSFSDIGSALQRRLDE
jgi:DNA-binding transcriptional LysR family regulator